jgi:hypothetical protein
MSRSREWYDGHEHDWRVKDGQGNSELFTEVRCELCGIPGERDEKSGEVFWPAT